ncbi:hypothetical protein [Virgibacillus salinus]|uniref:Uncharacterized protein n=1 Tax=Virgibacillus salinus TaxID=553311 RepID=A0A1H1DY10_9BACI|nr:hypothetical protein [Virgibacillus salinus]SDQ81337.1 hypothetical protein SAMN05216231_2634 [Virgibacillus salinus]
MSVKEEELLEEISGFLHGYLKTGTVRINSFLSKMNVNITNLNQLLTIRFLLKDETIDFVRDLPILLKRFKTTTVMQNETHIGEVRGEIDWAQTTKERMARNHKDRTIFSTNESIRSYNIPGNLVLKELLGLLYSTLYKDSYIKGFENAAWFSEWQQLKGNVAHAYNKNIYLQRVDQVHVSDRVIQKTLNHRNKLYRQAAKLLLSYRKLMSGNYSEEDIKILLRETFIAPDNVDVLFELYWIVQLIKQNTDESQLHLMDGSQNMVASWEKDSYVYRLYHDSTGSDVVQFGVGASEIAESDNPYIQQKYQSFTESNKLAQEFFGRKPSNSIWRGRPDFLLEVYEKYSVELVKLVIGEVKNTSRVEYATTGLEELLDYVHFVKDGKGEYLLGGDVEVKGMLCVGDVEMNEGANSREVRVMKRGERNYDLRIGKLNYILKQ